MTSNQIPEDEIPEDGIPKDGVPKDGIPENPFPGLRPDDFRDQWAMYLVRLQIDTKVLAGEVKSLHQQIKDRAGKVAEISVKLINAVDAQIQRSSEALDVSRVAMERQHAVFVKVMQEQHTEFAKSIQEQQSTFLSGLIAKQRSLDDDRRELQDEKQNWSIKRANQVAEIEADKKSLAVEVRKFWCLGFWGRVFVPKSLRELSKRYASAGSGS